MYRIHSPDLVHVRLDRFDFTVARDHPLHDVWVIKPVWDDDPELDLGVFLAVRQARHSGYTVWSSDREDWLLGHCNYLVDACDAILRFGIECFRPSRIVR